MTATTCGLCGHSPACGSAEGLDELVQRVPLCHADDHSCYHRWTVYKERPEGDGPVSRKTDAAAIRERVLSDPDVQRGVEDYVERCERGEVRQISRDEALRRIREDGA